MSVSNTPFTSSLPKLTTSDPSKNKKSPRNNNNDKQQQQQQQQVVNAKTTEIKTYDEFRYIYTSEIILFLSYYKS